MVGFKWQWTISWDFTFRSPVKVCSTPENVSHITFWHISYPFSKQYWPANFSQQAPRH